MLIFASTPLPQHPLTYVAFRLACLDTRERLELAHQLDLNQERNFGFLTEVPFLRNVPAQVQMELLLKTWQRHQDIMPHRATLLDEGILYAACETAAQIVRAEPEVARRFLARGPAPVEVPLNTLMVDALQKLHLRFAKQGLFLLISQFQDMPPDVAIPLKENCGLSDAVCDPLFDALGCWYVPEETLLAAEGLLTRVEMEQLRWLFNAAKCCHPR